MRKGTFIATLALLIAVAGAIVAFAAYFKHRGCTLCEDFGDEMMDDGATDLNYYATQMTDDENDEAEIAPEDRFSAAAEDGAAED